MDIHALRSPGDRLTEADLEIIRTAQVGLRGCPSSGMIDLLITSICSRVFSILGKRCMFWHLHALVWASRKGIEETSSEIVVVGRYCPSPMVWGHSYPENQTGTIASHVAYSSNRRQKLRGLFVTGKTNLGQPIVDADGVVQHIMQTIKADLRHDLSFCFTRLKHLYQINCRCGGGDSILKTANHRAETRTEMSGVRVK